jgi:hypothetical protein
LPSIQSKLISAKSVTGNIQVKQDEKGYLLTGTPDPLNTIVRLEFDTSVEPIALALPSVGSLTSGRTPTITTDAEGRLVAEVNLEKEQSIQRFELTIDNPGYLRGAGKPFDLQVKQKDGSWKTVYKGKIYGTICGKEIDPVTTKSVRLIVQTKGIKQLDLFQ